VYKDFEKKLLSDVLREGQVTAPTVFDCISVRTVELTNHKATILSGAALAYSMCGFPDMGLLNPEEVIYMTNRITNYTPLPVIVDAGICCGYDASSTYLNVLRLAKSGADAVVISDEIHGSGFDRQFQEGYKPEVCSIGLFLERIKAALKACENTKCWIIAKTEALIALGWDNALDRIKEARKLGSNMICVSGAVTLADAKKISAVDPGLKMWNGISVVDGKCAVEPKDLDKLGFVLVKEDYAVKAGMFGMLYYGKKTLEDGNTVFHDTHDYDGLLKKGQDYHELFSFWKLWLPLEDEFNDLSGIMGIPHEIEE
jgi:methylisocitrate lyase